MGTWDQWSWPLPDYQGRAPVISSGFKRPKHLGADIMYQRLEPGEPDLPWVTKRFEMPRGLPILAVGPGNVWSVTRGKKGQQIIIVDHHTVAGYGPLATMYIHGDFAVVKKGDVVKAGTVLARVSHSGTNIAHLHFACSTDVKDKWGVDPATLLSQWGPPRKMVMPMKGKPKAKAKVGKDIGWLIVLVVIALLSSKR